MHLFSSKIFRAFARWNFYPILSGREIFLFLCPHKNFIHIFKEGNYASEKNRAQKIFSGVRNFFSSGAGEKIFSRRKFRTYGEELFPARLRAFFLAQRMTRQFWKIVFLGDLSFSVFNIFLRKTNLYKSRRRCYTLQDLCNRLRRFLKRPRRGNLKRNGVSCYGK